MNTKALKQKILDLAIHGKLLPLDKVEKIRKEEPASILLEKIRAEKQEKIAKGELKKDKKDSFIFLGDDKRHYEKFVDGSVKDIEDEIPFDIPDGWSWVRGSEILSQMTSRKPTGDFFNYIDIDAIDNKKHKVKQPKKIKVSDAPSRASRELFSGDILFSLVRPYLENIAFISTEFEDCIASTGFFVCRPNGNIFPKYLYFLLISKYVISGLNEFMKGDNSPSINSDDIIKFFFPLPPLAEQQLIVSEIEKIFAQIDLLEQNKTDLQTAIKQAKSKILNLAIHGKLVSQDPNDEPASILLEKIRAEKEAKIAKGELKKDKKDSFIFLGDDKRHYEKFADGTEEEIETPFDLPKGWNWCRLGEICIVSSAKRVLQQDWKNSGIPFYRAREIAQLSNNEKVKDDLFISVDLYNELKKKYGVPKAGDLMVSAVGTIGKTYIVKEDDCFYYKDASVICFSKIEDRISSLYLKMICESNFVQDQMYSQSKGTTVDTITINKAQEYYIPLPPLSEQQRIVSKIEEIFAILDRISSELGADI